MPQLSPGMGPVGGDRGHRQERVPQPARPAGRSGGSPEGSSPAHASPTFEEVKLAAALGPGAGIDASRETRPARLQGPGVTGIAARRHHPEVAALEDVEVVIRICGAEGGVSGSRARGEKPHPSSQPPLPGPPLLPVQLHGALGVLGFWRLPPAFSAAFPAFIVHSLHSSLERVKADHSSLSRLAFHG